MINSRLIGVTQLRIKRQGLGTGSVSTQGRRFGGKRGKVREARVMVKFVSANAAQPVTHGLGFVPTSWQAMPQRLTTGAPGTIYADTPLQADRNVIVLRASTANTVAEIIVR